MISMPSKVMHLPVGGILFKLSLGEFKRLKKLLEQAGMSIDDLPDDID